MKEVLKQALEALETEVSIDWTNNDEFNASAEKMHDAITSLRQAIAELESQKPVAWRDRTYGTLMHQEWRDAAPLYTHPPQRKPLTDEQIAETFCKAPRQTQNAAWFAAGVRYAEAVHGIKEES